MASKGIKGFEVKGFKELYKSLGLSEDEIVKAALKGQKKLAANILGESQKLVPRVTGTLARSGHISTDEKTLTTTISYDTPYARRVHEGGIIKVNGYSVGEQTASAHPVKNFMGKGKTVIVKEHTRKAHSVKSYKTGNLKGAKYLERPFNEKSGELENFVFQEVEKALNKKGKMV